MISTYRVSFWLSLIVLFPQRAVGLGVYLRTEDDWDISEGACVAKRMVIFRDWCLSTCPKWTRLFNNDSHTCYAECPEDSIVSGFFCQSPVACTSKNQFVFNRTCVPYCPQNSSYVKDGVCYKVCPTDYISNGTDCITPIQCTRAGRYILNTTCVKSCPNETTFVKYGTCLHTCTPDTVRHGPSSCIYDKDCTNLNKVIYNGVCMDACPFEDHFRVSGKCYSSCPQGYIVNDQNCITNEECTEIEKGFIFNRTCVHTCPPEAPLLDEENKACYNKCRDQLVKHESHCISKAACVDITQYYKLVFNGTCVEKCGPTAQFVYREECFSECPYNYVSNGTLCLSPEECKSIGYVYNQTCVEKCPENAHFLYNQECFTKCLRDSFLDEKRCLHPHECKSIGYVYNQTCVEKCPPTAQFVFEKDCFPKCPNHSFSNGTQCLHPHQCISKWFIYKGKCIKSCPSEAPLKWNGECVDSCPADSSSNTTHCTSHSDCTQIQHKFLFRGMCVQNCPEEAPFVHNAHCLPKCPSTSDYKFVVSYKYSLKGGFYESSYMVGVNGTKCMDIVKCAEKGHFIYSDICVLKCPSGTSNQAFLKSPWNHICYSFEDRKIAAVFYSAVSFLCLSCVIKLGCNTPRNAVCKRWIRLVRILCSWRR